MEEKSRGTGIVLCYYPKIKETLYMKKGRSETPCSCALNLLSLELSDSAAALVDLLIK